MSEKNLLNVDIKNASYKAKNILRNVEFSLQKGELICLCGPNGSGKSTLLSLAAGIIPEGLTFCGDITIGDLNIKSIKVKERAKLISYMEQSVLSTWNFTVADFVLQGRFAYSKNGYYSEKDYEIVKDSLALLKISDFYNRNIHSLSGGEFQKVRIARELCQTPDFIFLDEPGSALDFVYEPQLLQTLKDIAVQKNIGILISIHDVNLAGRYAHKMLLLPIESSPIYGDTPHILNTENLSKTFGVDFECQKIDYYQSLQ